MSPIELPAAWRERAALLERHGAAEAAATLVQLALELELAIEEAANTELTLSEAAEESGYSERRLRQLVRAGEIEDHGRKGAPRLRRADLPRRSQRTPVGSGYDAGEHARAILGRAGGAG